MARTKIMTVAVRIEMNSWEENKYVRKRKTFTVSFQNLWRGTLISPWSGFLLLLKTPCPRQSTMSVIHFAFALRLVRVSSLSWGIMTGNRMYLIISVKAVFILICRLLMPSISLFLSSASRHSNYLIAGFLFVICRVWSPLKLKLKLDVQTKKEEILFPEELPSWGM